MCIRDRCGPCRVFGPVFEKASEKHPDLVFGKIDVDAQPELAGMLGVQSIPTVSVFRDGVLLVHQPGMMPPALLDQMIEKVRKVDMEKVRAAIAAAQQNEKGEPEEQDAEAADGPAERLNVA